MLRTARKILRTVNVAKRECCELLREKVANCYKISRFDWLKNERFFRLFQMVRFYWLKNVANRSHSGSHYQGLARKREPCEPLCVLTLERQDQMLRTVKKVANSDNCESYDIANPSFLSLKNRGLANPSKVANREQCESLRAHLK